MIAPSSPSESTARYIELNPENIPGSMIVFGCVDQASALIMVAASASSIVLIGDENVADIHSGFVDRIRQQCGRPVHLFTFPAGEAQKSLDVLESICRSMAHMGIDRHCVIAGFGGGVSTDMAGMAASMWMRGVRLLQVPTSLMAMADAAIGGKTAVNLPEGRNLVGAWKFPEYVFADVRFLETLPHAEIVCGLVEIVKTAAVGSSDLLAGIETCEDFQRPDLLGALAFNAAKVKAGLVTLDPYDTDVRQLLNFGHTVGHAIEAAASLAVPHGEAVAAGMAVESAVAVRLGLISGPERIRLMNALARIGAPTAPQVSFELASEFIFRDKKNMDGGVRLALPHGLGHFDLKHKNPSVSVSDSLVMECWNE